MNTEVPNVTIPESKTTIFKLEFTILFLLSRQTADHQILWKVHLGLSWVDRDFACRQSPASARTEHS